MTVLRSIYQNHLVLNCLCSHVGKVAVKDLMPKYGGDTTVGAVEKAARCSRCRGKNISSIQIIYIGNSELAMYNSHTPKENKDFQRTLPKTLSWTQKCKCVWYFTHRQYDDYKRSTETL